MIGAHDSHAPLAFREYGLRRGASPRLPAEHPLRGAGAFAVASLLYFAITYFEPMLVFGQKFSVVWRFLVVVPAIVLIATRPFVRDPATRALEPLFWSFLAFAMAPLVSIGVGSPDIKVAVEAFAQRLFPIIIVMMVISSRRFDVADLLVRAFPWFLCLVSVPVLAGLLRSTGISLEDVAGVDVSAYASVFQNIHSAALAHAIAALCAFTLLVRFGGRRNLGLILVVFGCLALTVITTARSGLLAVVLGMVTVAVLKRRVWLLLAVGALAAFAGLVVAVAMPELVDVAINRLLGRNIYVIDYSADAMTSGRLTLQAAALEAYAREPLASQLFGIGRTGTMEAISRYSGHYLIAHNAFVDELLNYGLFGFLALVASLVAGFRLAWVNARAGHPAGIALMLALLVYALLQGVDYSLQLSIIAIVLLLETRARFAATP